MADLGFSDLTWIDDSAANPFLQSLKNLDLNADEKLSFAEARGKALPLPESHATFVPHTEAEFERYRTHLLQSGTARYYSLKQNLSYRYGPDPTYDTPDSWYWERATLYENEPDLYKVGVLNLLDYRVTENGEREFLFRQNQTAGLGAMIFTVSAGAEPEQAQVRVYRAGFQLMMQHENAEVERLRVRILEGLFVYLSLAPDWMEDSVWEPLLDAVEGQMMLSKTGLIKNAGQPNGKPDQTKLPQNMAERFEKAERGYPGTDVDLDLMELMETHLLATGLRPDVVSEKTLTEVEKAKLVSALKLVPAVMFGIMDKRGIFSEKSLVIEVREDDLFNLKFDQARAYYDFKTGKMVLKASYFRQTSVQRLAEALIHEFAHAMDEYTYRDYFLSDYYSATKKRASAIFNPFVTPYASKNAKEFFAESTLAYFNGETDEDPELILTRGRSDRAELRRKTPEMYLALTLYLEPGNPQNPNPYFANPVVFSKKTFSVLSTMAMEFREYLSPDMPLDQLVVFFAGMTSDCDDDAIPADGLG